MKGLLGLLWMSYAMTQVYSGTIPEESISQLSKTPLPQQSYQFQSTVYNPNQAYTRPVQGTENLYRNTVVQNPQSNAASIPAFHQSSANQQQQTYSGIQQSLVNQQIQSVSGSQLSSSNQQPLSYSGTTQGSSNQQSQSYSGATQGSSNQQPQSYSGIIQGSTYQQPQSYSGITQGSSNQQLQSYSGTPQSSLNQQVQSYSGTQQIPLNQQQAYSGAQQGSLNQQQSYSRAQQIPVNQQQSYSRAQQIPLNQQQSYLQQSYASNSYNAKNIQNEPISHVRSQYNQVTASDISFNNQPFQSNFKQVEPQSVGKDQNAPERYDKINYNSQTASSGPVVDQYQSQVVEQTNQQNRGSTEESKQSLPNPVLDLVDSKSKTARKIPLVLITIQKNKNVLNTDKSKSNVKKQNIDTDTEGYGSQIAYSNVPVSSNRDFAESAANLGSFSSNVVQNKDSHRVEQNNIQVPSSRTEQKYDHVQVAPSVEQKYEQAQIAPSVEQGPWQASNQRNNVPLNQYRYPVLAGRNQESSEWKPVSKYGNRVESNFNSNQNVAFSQSSSKQSPYVESQRNLGYGSVYSPNVHSGQTSSQNAAVNYKAESDRGLVQQYAQNSDSLIRQTGLNDSRTDNPNYRVTSTYVQQVNVNTDYSPSSTNTKANGNTQNYFTQGNTGALGETYQQNEQKRTQAPFPYFPGDNRNQQYTAQAGLSQDGEKSNQDQRQQNLYHVNSVKTLPAAYENDRFGENSKKDNVLQSTTYSNASYNREQDGRNNYNFNNSPSSQQSSNQNNQNSPTQNQQSSNAGVSNSQKYFSNNVQSHSGQYAPSVSLRNVVSNNQQYFTNDAQPQSGQYTTSVSSQNIASNNRHFSNDNVDRQPRQYTTSVSSQNVASNNQQQFSNNVQPYSGQYAASVSSQNTAKSEDDTSINRNAEKLHQQAYNTNNYNSQSRVNSFDDRYKGDTLNFATVDQSRNIGTSQDNNYLPTQQFNKQNAVKSNQQIIQNSQNSERNEQNSYISGYNAVSSNVQQSNPSRSNSFGDSEKTVSTFVQNQNQNQNVRTDTQNYGRDSNEGYRSNSFQTDQKSDVSNYRQNNASPNEYHSQNIQKNVQQTNQPLASKINPSAQNQDASRISGNDVRQTVSASYGFIANQEGNINNKQLPRNYDYNLNKNSPNSNYGINWNENRNTGNNYDTNRNTATNYQANQQVAYNSPIREQFQETSKKDLSSNSESGLRNYQNLNYGSSESQNSVVGTKPEEISNVQTLNANQQQQYANKDGSNYSPNPTQVDVESFDGSSQDISKKGTEEENQEQPPEALLLVLVSAKRSAIEDNRNEEKDDINEGYESAPEEIVELLNENLNRKMILDSFHEVTKGEYKDDDEVSQEDAEVIDDSDKDKSH